MKKALTLFIVLLLLSLGTFGYFFIEINKEKDNVTVTERTVYGDKSYAENIKVNFKSTYNNLLFWNTTHTIGNDESTKTDFTFSKNFIYENPIVEDYLDIFSSLIFSFHDYVRNENTGIKNADVSGLDLAYKELAEEAEPFVEISKLIKISDYCDYYPLAVNCNFGNTGYASEDAVLKEIVKSFEDFFKIPVLPSEARRISLIINDSGMIVSGGSSAVFDELDSFNFSTYSAVTEKVCYLTFDNRTYYGELVDTSLIPGGYGIYRIPYSIKDEVPVFDFENLETVFKLDEEKTAVGLLLNHDKSKLHLITKEGTKAFLTVIDTNTHKELQKLELYNYEFMEVNISYTGKDLLLISCTEHIGDNAQDYMTVVTIDENGRCKKLFTVKNNSFYYDVNYSDVKLKDGKLYISDKLLKRYKQVDPNGNEYYYDQICSGFSLGIYDKTGMLFHGEYETSLNTGDNMRVSLDYKTNKIDLP